MAQEGRKGPMEQDQNLPPTPQSRKEQLEQWQAQKRMSVESGKRVRGTPVKEAPFSARLAGTPLARASQSVTTPGATSRAAAGGAPLGNNPALVNSETDGTQSTPHADRTAKYLHNASAKPASILSPIKMGYPQRTPSKVGTPKAARVPLPAPAESSKPARVPLPRTPLPSKGFKAPLLFEQKKTKEWTPSKGAMTGPLEAIAGRVAALKGALTPQGKGMQAGETSHEVSKPATALNSEGSLGATRGMGKSQPPVMKNELEGVDVEQAVHSSYWLGRIREAEVRGDHGSVITLFEQAVEFNAQPPVDLVKALQQYRAKHMGGRPAQSSAHLEPGPFKGQASNTTAAKTLTAPSQRQERQLGGEAQRSEAEGQITRKTVPTGLDTALVPAVNFELVINGSGKIEESGGGGVAPGDGSSDRDRGPLVERAGSPPPTVVLVTPVSPSERDRRATGGAQRKDSPPAQEKGQELQFYLTPLRQSPAKNASEPPMVGAEGNAQGTGDASQEQTPTNFLPTVTAPRSNTPNGTTSPETDRTDELPLLPPFSTPVDASPPGGSSPTTLLPQNWLPLTQPRTPASGLQTPKRSGHQTPKPVGLRTPKPSGLQTPTPSRLLNPNASDAQTLSGSPNSFPRARSPPESPERPAAVELHPAGGSPATPRTPMFRGAAPPVADVMLTPAVSPLGWQPDAGGQGPQEPGSGPGQSTPAAIQMPSVQRSASRVTADVIRTPGLSRRLNLDGEEPARTPIRTPLSRFALRSPNTGARRVPLFKGAEKLTPAKVSAPGSTVGAANGVKEVAPEKLTPAARTEVGGVGGVNEVAPEKLTLPTPGVAVGRMAGVNEVAAVAVESFRTAESQADCVGTLTSSLNQVTEFPVVLNGRKSLKPSPLNLSGAAKPASPAKSVSVPTVHLAGAGADQLSEPAANANQGGESDQSRGIEVTPPEEEHPALDGFVRMVAYVANETVQSGIAPVTSAVQVMETEEDTVRSPKKATSEVERWLRRARGQASPVTPADRMKRVVTSGSQVRAVGKAGPRPVEENQLEVDFPSVEDSGASSDTARSTESEAGVKTADVNASGKRPSPSVKTPRFGVRTLRNGPSPGETAGRRRGASEAGGVKTPVPGGGTLAQGVNTPKSGSKGTPMLRQERARLPQLVIDNSKRTPVIGGRPGRGRRFNNLVDTPPTARVSSRLETLTPGAATADEWVAAADQIHQDQVKLSVSLNPTAFGSPVSPVNEAASRPETPPPSETSPEFAPLLERLNQVSPRVSNPVRQLSSRFTPSRLSRPPASSTSSPVNTLDQSKTPVARLAGDRGLNTGGKILGSPAQRTPGLHGARSAGRTGTRELRQLTGAPKLLGQGAAAAPAVTTILSPVRASKHDRVALGADRFVLSPVRRSGRKPTGEVATKQSKSEVEELLEMTGYTYTPNKALSEPTSARKTPAARRMALLTSGGSPPELEDAATCQEEEDATWQHVGAEEDTDAGDVGKGEEGEANGNVEIDGTAEKAETLASGAEFLRESPVGTESCEELGTAVGISELTNSRGDEPEQDERRPNVTVSDGSPQGMTSVGGPSELPAHDTQPKEAEGLSQGDCVNAVRDVECLPAGEGGVAVHTKRATRRPAADASRAKAPKKPWVVRQTLAEGLEANPQRKATGRKSVAASTVLTGRYEQERPVQEKTGLLQNCVQETGGDALMENGVKVTGGEGLADGRGLTTESSSETGLRRGKAGKTVIYAAKVEAAVSESVKEAVSRESVRLQADNGRSVKERVRSKRAGNRRKSLGVGLLAGHDVEKETGGVADANGGQELTTKETGAEQTRKKASGRKRVSFAASANPDGGNETANTERRPQSNTARSSARKRSEIAGLLPPGAADVSEGVTETESAGACISRSLSEQEDSGVGAKAVAKKGRGRRAAANTIVATESALDGALAIGPHDVSNSATPAPEATAAAIGAKGRYARSKGAVSTGAGREGVTSAGRTRGSRAAVSDVAEGAEAEIPPKRGRGRKRPVEKDGEPVNGTGRTLQTQSTEAGETEHRADVTDENVETTLPQGPIGSRRTGRKSIAPGPEVSAAQPETGPVGRAAVGKERRGVLEDSTNVQEGKGATGARGRGAVKGRGEGEAGPGKSVNTVERPADVPVGTRIEVWWSDDKRYYGGLVTEYKARSGKHKVVYDDGDSEELLLSTETWRLEKARPARRANAARTR